MTAVRFQLFEDPAVQQEYVAELQRAGVQPVVDERGAVRFREDQPEPFVSAAHRIRRARFRWYLVRCQNSAQTDRLRRLLKAERLPFLVEHCETGTLFSVPRADQERHQVLFAQC